MWSLVLRELLCHTLITKPSGHPDTLCVNLSKSGQISSHYGFTQGNADYATSNPNTMQHCNGCCLVTRLIVVIKKKLGDFPEIIYVCNSFRTNNQSNLRVASCKRNRSTLVSPIPGKVDLRK